MQNGTQSHPTESAEGNTLCDAGAVLPLWEDITPMYGSDSGTEDCTGCDRIERSESESVRQRAKILREAGVRVEEDFLREECDALNPVFFSHYITTGLPYVVMKYAMTADGKIATKQGASKWISGEEARSSWYMRCAMTIWRSWRNRNGSGRWSDAECASGGKKSPVRIICDSMLRIPLDSQICQTAGRYRTIVAYAGEKECDLFQEEKTQSGKAPGRASQSSFGKREINLQLLMKAWGAGLTVYLLRAVEL